MYDETITYATESSLEIFQNGSTKMQNALIEEWINSFKENMGSQVKNPIREIHCTVKSPFTNIEATFVFNVMEGVTVTKALLLYTYITFLFNTWIWIDLELIKSILYSDTLEILLLNTSMTNTHKRKGLIVQCNFGLCAASEPYLY